MKIGERMRIGETTDNKKNDKCFKKVFNIRYIKIKYEITSSI